jgi:glycine oxidase
MRVGNAHSEMLIVGGGIIGLALARRLSLAGLSVTVMDQGQPGKEASAAGAGILAAQADMRADNPLNQLSLASRSLYSEFVRDVSEQSGRGIEFSNSGLIYAAFSEEEFQHLQQKHKWQRNAGLAVQYLSDQELFQLEPALDGLIVGGVLFPDDGYVDNLSLIEALHLCCLARNVRMVTEQKVLSITSRDSTVTGVQTAAGFWPADVVVIAAGCWSGLIQMQPLSPLPVTPVRGQMIAVKAGRQLFTRVIYSSRTYLVPRKNGLILLGSTIEKDGYEKKVTLDGLQQIISGSIVLSTSITHLPVVDCWAGLRPCTEGELPLLGATGIRSLYVATGHYRNGLLLAPITAELMTQLITTGHTPEMLTNFTLNS